MLTSAWNLKQKSIDLPLPFKDMNFSNDLCTAKNKEKEENEKKNP